MNSGPSALSRTIAALERERSKPTDQQRADLVRKWEREMQFLQPRGVRSVYHDDDEE